MSLPEAKGCSHAMAVRGDVAVIGMACVFPQAPDVETFWHNIVNKVDAITDVPPERWDPTIFFDPDSYANDRVYSKRGGYLTYPVQFNPADVGVIPLTAIHGEPEQFLALMVAHHALADAGYLDRPTNRDRTQVIMGRGNYLNRGILTMLQHVRGVEDALRMIQSVRPDITAEELQAIKEELKANLPIFNADTAATFIPNLTTGRIANRLDLMGTNFTVDAACASSLVAAEIGVRDLLTRKCDLALVGGIYVSTDVGFQSIFCQLHALSHRSQIRPFDKDADGLLLGEGAGCIVLKRLEDAERDSDRMYAVIKGVGTSSDGRAMGVLAPRVEGEELAIRRAYEMAGIPPETVQLIEAHGTATLAGDLAEIQAMTRVFGHRDAPLPWCGVGSIKSMIGHIMPAAGIAGLIKTALALHHKTLPPTLHCEQPNPRLELEKTPFYINTKTRPWIHGAEDRPRRAGVNAFGFGGINAHVILEEYRSPEEAELPSHLLHWETEVCIFQGDTRQALTEQMCHVRQYLQGAPLVSLKDLAYTLNRALQQPYRLAVVASSLNDLGEKLDRAVQRVSDPQRRQIQDREGIYFFEEPFHPEGRLAYLFPGVGAAYMNMLSDLCLHFPEVRSCFDLADQLFTPRKQPSLLPSQVIYPPPDPAGQGRSQAQQRLWQEDGILEAIYAADGAFYTLLHRLGVRPDLMVGHSFGDFFSLVCAASQEAPREVLIEAMVALENSVHSTVRIYEQLRTGGKIPDDLTLINVGSDSATVSSLFEGIDGPLYISMDNCPHQVVVVGARRAVVQLIASLKGKGIFYEELPFAQPAYHTPLFAVARDAMAEHQLMPPTHLMEVYSCTTASPYPQDPTGIQQLSLEHWMRRVEFRKTIEAMYEAGARVFVEVGPGGILTAFVDDILRGRPHLAMACNVSRRSGITQFNHVVGMLASQRVPMHLEYLYKRRAPRLLSLDLTDVPTNRDNTPGLVNLALLGTPTLKLSRPSPTERRASSDNSGGPRQAATARLPSHTNGQEQDAQDLSSPLAKESHVLAHTQAPPPYDHRDGQRPASPSDASVTGSSSAPGGVGHVMQNYLQTMDAFLQTQSEVMHSLMAEARIVASPARQPGPLSDHVPQSTPATEEPFPFVGRIVSEVPSQEVVVQRQIDLSEDLFLHDHTFGGQVSAVDASLEPLPVIPMTAAMEAMAETAALLMPGKLLIGMRDVQTYQWLDLARERMTLQISARRRAVQEQEIEVQIYNLGEKGEEKSEKGDLALQGIMVFGDGYPEAPAVHPLPLTSPRAPEFSAEEMYREGLMFHGPRFQGVASLETVAKEGVVGQLRVLSTHTLFHSTSQPRLLTDFTLLDAAGQVFGYWPLEWVDTGYVMFPIRIDALHIYGPSLPPGQRVTCQVQTRDIHQKYMRADIDILRPDGRLWMRLEGWCDWRFFCPDATYEFARFPDQVIPSTLMPAPIAQFPSPADFECYMAEYSDGLYSRDAVGFWVKMWARLVFNHQERREFHGLGGPEQRRIERLLAHIAAKDATRRLLKAHHGLSVYPADIEISKDEHGRPEPQGYWLQQIGYTPALSISHSNQLAIAIAGRCTDAQHLGVDVQQIEPRSPGFEEAAFAALERRFLDNLSDIVRQEWLTRFWCAKEAVGKALGRGLPNGPRSVIIREFDDATGIVNVAVGEQFTEEYPALVGVPMIVYTTRHQSFIIASTLCERA